MFKRDPVNLIRFFARAEQTGAFFHPNAVRLLRRSLRLIDDKLRNDAEANRIFLDMLCSEKNPEATLRRMNEAGVLGRFVPEFGKVVSMMQFNMYHHYTVDEHLIRTVGVLSDIEHGAAAEPHPLSTSHLQDHPAPPRALRGRLPARHRQGPRSRTTRIAGARIARTLCPRFGMSAAETETVAWLIEQHLIMSSIAFSRDIGDPKTIRDFANVVQSPERLKLLLVLTVADIRAVGPSAWNGWKGQLLRGLYYETEPVVAGGHTQLASRERVAAAQAAFRAAVADWPAEEVERFIERHYPDYWLRTETRKVGRARQADRAPPSRRARSSPATSPPMPSRPSPSCRCSRPTIRACWRCSPAPAPPPAPTSPARTSPPRATASRSTPSCWRASSTQDEDELRRARRIAETIEKLLKGEVRLGALMAKRRERQRPARRLHGGARGAGRQRRSPTSSPSSRCRGSTGPGLLFELTSTLSDLNLDITSAHITTFGEKAVDVFYVTDLTNKKITSPQRQKAIRERLLEVLGGDAGVEPPRPRAVAAHSQGVDLRVRHIRDSTSTLIPAQSGAI